MSLQKFYSIIQNSINNIINTEKKDDGYNVHFLAAGYDKDEIDISLENGYLSVKGKKDENDVKLYLDSSIYVGDKFEHDKIEAKLDKGILTISLKYNPKISKKIMIS